MNKTNRTQTGGPLFPDQVSLVGRDELIRDIRRRLHDRSRVLLVGPKGIGKTAILASLVESGLARSLHRLLVLSRETTGVRAIVDAAQPFCSSPGVLAKSRQNAEGGFRFPGRPAGGLRERRSELYRRVREERWLFVLDHFSSRDPAIRRLFEYLFDFDVLALGATRSTRPDDLGNMARTTWCWDVVKVPPLALSACRQLAERLSQNWPVDSNCHEDFLRRLLGLADGNPGVIVEICHRAALKLAAGNGKIAPNSLWLDWRGEQCRVANE